MASKGLKQNETQRRECGGLVFRSKGQQEVISVVLISGILIGVVGSVYFWGVPLIQKNKDISILESAEDFMRGLDNKIKFVTNNGGRDQMTVSVPGALRYDSSSRTLELTVETEGTIYATSAEIPLGRNSDCTASTGTFGINEPDTLCVRSIKISDKKFRTVYTLKYVRLINNNILRDFSIELSGNSNSGGQQNAVSFENSGNTESGSAGRTLISTIIEIRII